MISGTYKPDGGKIWFDGKLLSNKDTIAQRSHLGIGRTFQTPKPFGNLTVYDNVYAICLQKYDFKTSHKKTQEILEMSSLRILPRSPAASSPSKSASGWTWPACWPPSRSSS